MIFSPYTIFSTSADTREMDSVLVLAVSTCYIVAMAFKLRMLLTFLRAQYTHTSPDASSSHRALFPCLPSKPELLLFYFLMLRFVCVRCGHLIQFHNFIQIAFLLLLPFFHYWIWWCWRQSNTMTGQRCILENVDAYWLRRNPLFCRNMFQCSAGFYRLITREQQASEREMSERVCAMTACHIFGYTNQELKSC